MFKVFFPLLTLLLLLHCSTPKESPMSPDPDYVQAIETWRKERVESLTATNSWLALAGLYPLEEGQNTFGSSSENDLIFPEKAAKKLGILTLEGGTVNMTLEPGISAKINANLADEEMIIFQNSAAEKISYNTFSWVVIQREEKYFLRVWDADNKAIQEFEGIDYYPIQEQWRVEATFVENKQSLAIRNVLEMDIMQESEGILRFVIQGKQYELLTLDGGPNDYFMIFSDQTTGTETYGGGRYLYVEKPDAAGRTWIDFNKAYNPPCVFTPYATCPLPPKANHLDIAVKAGEKDYGHH